MRHRAVTILHAIQARGRDLWFGGPHRSPLVRPLVLFAFFAMAAIVAATALILFRTREAVLADAEQQLARMSRIIEQQTAGEFRDANLVLAGVARDMLLDGIDTPDSYRKQRADLATHIMLKQRVAVIPQLTALTMVDSNGNLINFSNDYPIPKLNMADRDYFLALKGDATISRFLSAPVPNRSAGTWAINLARRVETHDHVFAGVLLATIDLGYFEGLYRDSALGSGYVVSLLGNDGTILARFPSDSATIGRVIDGPITPQDQSSITLRKAGPSDQVAKVIARYRLPDYPLTVAVRQTEDDILKDWRRQAWTLSVAAAIAVGAVLLTAIVLARQFLAYAALARAQLEVSQAQARQAKAEALSAAKSQFLANMSHELRTPLNAVIGFSEIMEAEMYGPLGAAKYREYVGDIHRAGSHLLGIVTDILDFSACEAQKLGIDYDTIGLPAILTDACDLLRHQAEQAGVTITVAPDAHLPEVSTDRRRLTQILVNLISNAVKFTPSGGRIGITAAPSDLGVAITVRDSGIGIAAQDIDLILTPFGQVESSVARRHHGTGLGLPLARSLAEALGGSLTLESTLGIGTVVTVEIPIRPPMRANPVGSSALETA